MKEPYELSQGMPVLDPLSNVWLANDHRVKPPACQVSGLVGVVLFARSVAVLNEHQGGGFAMARKVDVGVDYLSLIDANLKIHKGRNLEGPRF